MLFVGFFVCFEQPTLTVYVFVAVSHPDRDLFMIAIFEEHNYV